jgi:hypothetical protein
LCIKKAKRLASLFASLRTRGIEFKPIGIL